MKASILASLLVVGIAHHANADLTLHQTTSGKALGISGAASATVYIKGNKMRTDTEDGKRTTTVIFDLDEQKMYMLDSRRKRADVWNLQDFADDMSAGVDLSGIQTSITPNGLTREIAGLATTGYDMEIIVSAEISAGQEMAMIVTLTGPVWIVEDAPGTADYKHFYVSAVEKGWIFTDPRAAKVNPGQARSMSEMYRQFAELGGIPYGSEFQIKLSSAGEGGGMGSMMGDLMAKMGGVSATTEVQSADTSPLTDDLFTVPAGYKLRTQE
jgi:hypothetical protein